MGHLLSKPVKNIYNPVTLPYDAWDGAENFFTLLYIDGVYKRWYTCFNPSSEAYIGVGYEYSTDLVTWIKPVLNQISFEGNTNNNLIFGAGASIAGVVYSQGQVRPYTLQLAVRSNLNGSWLYDSPDGITDWQLVSTPIPNPSNFVPGELKYFNGLWHIYSQWSSSTARGITVHTCPTRTGSWTYQGIKIPASNENRQRYQMTVFQVNNVWYGAVSVFSNATDRMFALELYTTTDGITFNLVDTAWIAAGDTSDLWDFGMMGMVSCVPYGSSWRAYYTGAKELHSAGVTPLTRYMGWASFGSEDLTMGVRTILGNHDGLIKKTNGSSGGTIKTI
jgi:hypothetical protein